MPARPKKASRTPSQARELAFGQHLRRLRQGKGLSQNQLAAASGLSPESIRNYEAGRQDPTLTRLRQLAKGLGVELREVLPQGNAA